MSASGQGMERPPIVLVVDDEPQIRAFLDLTLSDAGFSVRTAEDGVAALALLRADRPAAIVTDLMMPRMDGWELCRRVRAEAATATIPLVVISALHATAAPGDAYLSKPFELDALIAVLRRLTASAAVSGVADQPQTRRLPRSCATGPQPMR